MGVMRACMVGRKENAFGYFLNDGEDDVMSSLGIIVLNLLIWGLAFYSLGALLMR